MVEAAVVAAAAAGPAVVVFVFVAAAPAAAATVAAEAVAVAVGAAVDVAVVVAAAMGNCPSPEGRWIHGNRARIPLGPDTTDDAVVVDATTYGPESPWVHLCREYP